MNIGIVTTNAKVEMWLCELLAIMVNEPRYEIFLIELPAELPKKEPIAATILRKIELALPGANDDVLAWVEPPKAVSGQEHQIIIDDWGGVAETLVKHDIHVVIASGNLTNKVTNWPATSKVWIPAFSSSASQVPGFREVLDSDPAILVMLQEYSNEGIRVIEDCSTRPDRISPLRTRNTLYRKVATFITRALEAQPLLERRSATKDSLVVEHRPIRYPRTSSALRMLAKLGARILSAQVLNWIKPEIWYLSWIDSSALEFDESLFSTALIPPSGRIWADPFMYVRDGETWLFYEDAPTHVNSGFIAAARYDKKRRQLDEPVIALKRDYHLSYPMLFEYNDELYMLPETSQQRTIEVYRCVSFPDQWEQVSMLMENVIATDSTLFEKDGLWYLYTSLRSRGRDPSDDELYLFYSDNPLSTDWTPHPMNPVVKGVENARCAGRLFVENGNLYRPSQDCSGFYGRAINLNLVESITPDRYRERKVRWLQPMSGTKGIHTINSVENFTIVDSKTRLWRWSSKYRTSSR